MNYSYHEKEFFGLIFKVKFWKTKEETDPANARIVYHFPIPNTPSFELRIVVYEGDGETTVYLGNYVEERPNNPKIIYSSRHPNPKYFNNAMKKTQLHVEGLVLPNETMGS